jgi:hypothetical protein
LGFRHLTNKTCGGATPMGQTSAAVSRSPPASDTTRHRPSRTWYHSCHHRTGRASSASPAAVIPAPQPGSLDVSPEPSAGRRPAGYLQYEPTPWRVCWNGMTPLYLVCAAARNFYGIRGGSIPTDLNTSSVVTSHASSPTAGSAPAIPALVQRPS